MSGSVIGLTLSSRCTESDREVGIELLRGAPLSESSAARFVRKHATDGGGVRFSDAASAPRIISLFDVVRSSFSRCSRKPALRACGRAAVRRIPWGTPGSSMRFASRAPVTLPSLPCLSSCLTAPSSLPLCFCFESDEPLSRCMAERLAPALPPYAAQHSQWNH